MDYQPVIKRVERIVFDAEKNSSIFSRSKVFVVDDVAILCRRIREMEAEIESLKNKSRPSISSYNGDCDFMVPED